MPKVSKESASGGGDYGMVVDHSEDVDGYTINLITFREDIDHAPLLKGLPDDRCQCPHWGYVFKGRITVRYDDHEEVCVAGDAFYMSPGHAPAAEAGTELLMISPTPEFNELQAAMMKAMQG